VRAPRARARADARTPQPATTHITHVFNTADPIAMGTCTGVLSSCALGGYAMESKCAARARSRRLPLMFQRFERRCHLGKSIVYDTVAELGWSANIANHGIVSVIENILNRTWPAAEKAGREVPAPRKEDDCVVRAPAR
jgi:lipase ATG15